MEIDTQGSLMSEFRAPFVTQLKPETKSRPIFAQVSFLCRLGGVVASVLATEPKGCGFKTRPKRWIFKGDKNPQHTFLSDGK
jgi:hypothetical protein